MKNLLLLHRSTPKDRAEKTLRKIAAIDRSSEKKELKVRKKVFRKKGRKILPDFR